MKKYRLNVARDVDQDEDTFMLNLDYGWRFYDDLVHVRGFDSMADLRAAVKTDVIPCECSECAAMTLHRLLKGTK
jgi:hypothetical protein